MGVPLMDQNNGGGEGKLAANRDKHLGHEITNTIHVARHTVTGTTIRAAGSNSVADIVLTSQGEPAEPTDKDLPYAYPFSEQPPPLMYRNGHNFSLELNNQPPISESLSNAPSSKPSLTWDWSIEHEDRKKERKADQALRDATPFEVDRKLLKDVVREKMGEDVGRIKFLSAGTFHKAYLITLVDGQELVARVARRFMPRLKTESEVATINFLRQKTNVPVPTIYHYDSNPYNRLGGEFILMSKASGIPLAQVYHGMSYNDLVKLLKNLAVIIVPLFAQRFSQIGSLYFGADPHAVSSGAPTPKASQCGHYSAFPFSPTLGMFNIPSTMSTPKHSSLAVPTLKALVNQEYHVGPIISWPFFGSNRGELSHPQELNRGPWPTTASYLSSCVDRETQGVILESEGKAAPHRLHLDPDEIHTSRHHRLRAVPGDESDDSDEWNLEESEDEWEGPGDAMYRDYRRNQRSTFLVAHMKQREEAVRREMGRWQNLMQQLIEQIKKEDLPEGFGLDCHDLSLENVFVDEEDNTKVTCIIDWESTTIRPLWACAHVPAFLQSSPFMTKLFREIVSQLPNDPSLHIQLPQTTFGKPNDLARLCREWLYYESAGIRLRMAHRCVEWDGWEEGLVDSILGPEEVESEWLTYGTSANFEAIRAMITSPHNESSLSGMASLSRRHQNGRAIPGAAGRVGKAKAPLAPVAVKLSTKLPMHAEQAKEQMLNMTGDICGGRGGELGRRLEAWLSVNGLDGSEQESKWKDGEEHTVPSR